MPVNQQLLLSIAEGTIDAQPRIERGEIDEAHIDQLETDIQTARFYRRLEQGVFIPFKCVDGRITALIGPNAAGGTFTLVAADALSHDTYRHHDQLTGQKAKAPEHAKTLYSDLIARGHKIGGHDDEHAKAAHGPNCGCGAEDKFDSYNPEDPSILRYIGRRGRDIQATLLSLGVEVNDELAARIVAKSRQLHAEAYATTGADLRDSFTDIAGDDAIETLPGTHNEVAVVLNMEAGTTLDRVALAEVYTEAYEVFNVDVWAIKQSCEYISSSTEEAHEKFVAALFYNVATAAVLAGQSTRVIVRSGEAAAV